MKWEWLDFRIQKQKGASEGVKLNEVAAIYQNILQIAFVPDKLKIVDGGSVPFSKVILESTAET